MEGVKMLYRKILTGILFSLILVLVFSCTEEGTIVQGQREEQYVSLFEVSDLEMTPQEIGSAHGEIVNIFVDNLFNKELVCNRDLKKEFIKNNGTDTKTFKKVFIKSVNQYFSERNINVRMTKNDFSKLIEQFNCNNCNFVNLGSRKGDQLEKVNFYLEHLESEKLINADTRQICQTQLSRIEEHYVSFKDLSNRSLLTVSDNEYKRAEFPGKVFMEVAINSAETWSALSDSVGINDPELGSWWDWFRDGGKKIAICAVASDAVGGIIGTAATGGNAYAGYVGAAAASAGYLTWAL